MAGTRRTPPRWTIGMDEASARVMAQVRSNARPGTPVPTPDQVAAVLHALADHTALVQAVSWRPEPDEGAALSVGRWLHDLGDLLEGRGPYATLPSDDDVPGPWLNVMTRSNHCLFSSRSRSEVEAFIRDRLVPGTDVGVQESSEPIVA